MLRYYDEMGLLKPEKIDQYTDYRFYSAKQISTLNKIIFLRDLDFPVKEMGLLLQNWDDEMILSELERREERVEQTIIQEKQKLSKLRKIFSDIQMGLSNIL